MASETHSLSFFWQHLSRVGMSQRSPQHILRGPGVCGNTQCRRPLGWIAECRFFIFWGVQLQLGSCSATILWAYSAIAVPEIGLSEQAQRIRRWRWRWITQALFLCLHVLLDLGPFPSTLMILLCRPGFVRSADSPKLLKIPPPRLLTP